MLEPTFYTHKLRKKTVQDRPMGIFLQGFKNLVGMGANLLYLQGLEKDLAGLSKREKDLAGLSKTHANFPKLDKTVLLLVQGHISKVQGAIFDRIFVRNPFHKYPCYGKTVL